MGYSKFDKEFDVEALKNDAQAAEQGGGDFKEVPAGTYEVSIDKMELTESKKGDPMVSIWFKILEGEFKDQRLFYNQVIKQGFQIHIMNTFLKSLDSGVEVVFNSFGQYEDMLLDIQEQIDSQRLEYAIKYSIVKGFASYEIKDVFESEKTEPEADDEEDEPF